MNTENPKSELIFEAVANPAVSPIMLVHSDSRMGDEDNYSATYGTGNLAAMGGGINIPSLIWLEPTEPASEVISPQETIYGDSNSTVIAFDKALGSPYGYPSSVSCFGCVLRMAVGLSIILAITSLLLLCCLSRRGQYVWINTVNIVGTQNPIVQPERGQEHHRNDPGSGDMLEERSSSGQNIDGVNEPEITPGRGIRSMETGDLDGSGTTSKQGVQSSKRKFLPGGWITRVGWPRASLSLDIPTPNRPGVFQRWFGSNLSQVKILKRPWFFQRWFRWKREKHVNFDDSPLYGPRNGQRIHSVRTRGSTDPSIILTEVAERLVRERMRQLSTILSIGEEEEAQAAIVRSAEEPETLSMSSIRAVATGSTTGTQRRDNTVRRNRHSVLKTYSDTDGAATPPPISATDDTGVGDEIWREEFVGEERELNGEPIPSVRHDDSVDNAEGKDTRSFRRAPIRQYLFPTPMDNNPLVVEVSASEDIVDVKDFVRKGEVATGSWGDTTSGNTNNTVSTSSTLSGATGTELRRQSEGGIEVETRGRSSISNDSTLTVGSDENVGPVLVDGQLPIKEERRSIPRETVASSGFAMGSDLVLSRPARIPWNTHMIEDIITDECGVSAFGLRGKSPRWDSQTSNGDSESGYGELGSSCFTESSGDDNLEGQLDSGSFLPADPIRKDVEGEINMHGGIQLRVD